MIKVRLPNANRGALRQIGKLLEKLERCANDDDEVINFLRDLANQPLLLDKATITLSCFASVEATDALISILEQQRGTEAFERIALKAIGVGGRYKRPAVARYLSELPVDAVASQELRDAMQQLLVNS